MDKITTVGLDIAKSVFSVHAVDGQGRTVLRKTVRRDNLTGPTPTVARENVPRTGGSS